MDKIELGKRLAEARVRLNLSQKEVADAVGLPAHQTVSTIEAGLRGLQAWELAKLVELYKINMQDLFKAQQPPAPIVLWRDEPDEACEIIEVEFLQKCRWYKMVEEACGVETRPRLPKYDDRVENMPIGEVEEFAQQVGRELGLGTRPAASLSNILESKCHVKIWHRYLHDGSAATTWGEFGPAILLNLNEVSWRRNFSLAHELFHLGTWDNRFTKTWKSETDEWNYIEKLANVFASNLLLPADEVRVEFLRKIEDGLISYFSLVEIARSFDVSTTALIWRLINLGLIDKEHGKKIPSDKNFRSIDRASWPTAKEFNTTLPKRYVLLAFLGYKKGNLSRSRLAEVLETHLADLPEKLAEYGFDEEDDYKANVAVA